MHTQTNSTPTLKANVRAYTAKGKTLYRIDFCTRNQAGHIVRFQRRGFQTKEEAQEEAEKLAAAARYGLLDPRKAKATPTHANEAHPEPPTPTTREAIEKTLVFLERTKARKPATLAAYQRAAARLPAKLLKTPWHQLTQRDVDPLLEQKANSVVAHEIEVLKTTAKLSMRVLGVPAPTVDWTYQRRPAALKTSTITPQQLDQLASASGTYASLLRLAYYTGMRVGEIAALRWQDVDWKNETVVVSRGISCGVETTPKGGRPRTIPLCQPAMDALRTLWNARENDTDRITNRNPDTLRCTLLRACKKTRIDASWHTLRHSFASNLVAAGVDLYTVATLLGHKNPIVTTRYAHLAPSGLRQAVNSLVS